MTSPCLDVGLELWSDSGLQFKKNRVGVVVLKTEKTTVFVVQTDCESLR